ncbi:hypothetical protein LDENG_00182470 [Lucifuga dentata]|nr:hypothetical protein LDENG_00182470 [Lucifuga dentata]
MSTVRLQQGDVSLQISTLRLSDEGTYRCFLPAEATSATFQLLLSSVSSPVISLSGIDRKSGGVVLACDANRWYPEPEVFWLDGEGRVLSAGHPETLRGPDGLYAVSSRVTVEKIHGNTFTCSLRQNNINQTRETHVHVPDDFFAAPSSCAAGISVTLVLCFLFLLAVGFFLWKWKLKKTKADDEEKKTESQSLMDGDREVKPDEKLEKKNEEEKEVKPDEELKKKSEVMADVALKLETHRDVLNKHRDQLTADKAEMEKMIEEMEKLQSVEKEKLEKTILDIKNKLTDRKQQREQLELNATELVNETQGLIKTLKSEEKIKGQAEKPRDENDTGLPLTT